jgi:hypothetical protein
VAAATTKPTIGTAALARRHHTSPLIEYRFFVHADDTPAIMLEKYEINKFLFLPKKNPEDASTKLPAETWHDDNLKKNLGICIRSQQLAVHSALSLAFANTLTPASACVDRDLSAYLDASFYT